MKLLLLHVNQFVDNIHLILNHYNYIHLILLMFAYYYYYYYYYEMVYSQLVQFLEYYLNLFHVQIVFLVVNTELQPIF